MVLPGPASSEVEHSPRPRFDTAVRKEFFRAKSRDIILRGPHHRGIIETDDKEDRRKKKFCFIILPHCLK